MFSTNVNFQPETYCGPINNIGLPHSQGCIQWSSQNNFQKYSGDFFHNNYHKHGSYFVLDSKERLFYDGSFYVNKLEGYGEVIYRDGTRFEGLFKEHGRFGPGVYTDNGTQNVGLWYGPSLIRLAEVVGDVPKLAETQEGWLNLLKYKDLMAVNRKPRNIAFEMVGKGEVDSELLYNTEIRNTNSLYFNRSLYDDDFYNDATIEAIAEDSTDRNCCCCSNDRFTQLCVQLSELEDKLHVIRKKKDKTLSKIALCEQCCLEPTREKSLLPSEFRPSVMPPEFRDAFLPTLQGEQEFCNYQSSLMDEAKCATSVKFDTSEMQSFVVQENSQMELLPNSEMNIGEIPPKIDNRWDSDSFTFLPEDNQSEIFVTEGNDSEGLGSQPFAISESSNREVRSHFKGSQLFEVNHSRSEDMQKKLHDFPDLAKKSIDFVVLKTTPSQTVKELTKKCNCKETRDKLEKNLAVITEEELFYEIIKNRLKIKLDKEYVKIYELRSFSTYKTTINDILAWNNGKVMKEMLWQSFKHRKSEENVTFNLTSVLIGNRDCFLPAGNYEIHCKQYLEECFKGSLMAIRILQQNALNPDLSDAKGNTGIILASVNDQIDVIRKLVKFGANIDLVNDEGLNPLILCLLRYIAHKFNVEIWEKAFLENDPLNQDLNDMIQASFHRYLDFVDAKLGPENTVEVTKKKELKQSYLFSLDYKIPMKKKEKKEKKGKKTSKKSSKASKKSSKTSKKSKKGTKKETEDAPEEMIDTVLPAIKTTILGLLSCGSNPNRGKTPFPPLILSIFSEDLSLVENLLKYNADPNTVIEENLNPLHVLASLPPSEINKEMCRIFVQCKTNPNSRTDPSHWKQLKSGLTGKSGEEIEDEGKNVLHLLCVRQDFEEDSNNYMGEIATILLQNGCKFKEYYLGHTPLSLAVLRGNLNLINVLLKVCKSNPNQVLLHNMGNVLTLFGLKRFSGMFELKYCRKIIDYLLELNVNPLQDIDKFENVVSFMNNEQIVEKGPKKGKKDKKSGKSSKSSKKSKKETKNTPKAIASYLNTKAKLALLTNIQCKATKYLYCIYFDNVFDSSLKDIAKLIPTEKVLNYLEVLFQTGEIQQNRFDLQCIESFLNFIQTENGDKRVKNSKTENCNFNLNPTSQKLDNNKTAKFYKVCFNCLLRHNKKLFFCPKCEFIYFCSEKCNLISNKKRQHKCNYNFYKEEQEMEKEREKSGDYTPRTKNIRQLVRLCEQVREEREQHLMYLKEEKTGKKISRPLSVQHSTKKKKKKKSVVNKVESSFLIDYSNVAKPDFRFQDDTEEIVEKLKSIRKSKLDVSLQKKMKSRHSIRDLSEKATLAKREKVVKERKSAFLHNLLGTINLEYMKRNEEDKDNEKKVAESDSVRSTTHPDYRHFMAFLTRIFPDFNLPLLVLPYACFKNGQMYYQFTENKPYFTKNYRKLLQ